MRTPAAQLTDETAETGLDDDSYGEAASLPR